MISMTEVKTDVEPFDLTEIPLSADIRTAKVFKEGHSKYGRGNWRSGVHDKKYQLERANHALKHLKLYIYKLEFGEEHSLHEAGEDDLAKVRWFCDTQMEIERLETIDSEVKCTCAVVETKTDGKYRVMSSTCAVHWGYYRKSVEEWDKNNNDTSSI